MITSVVFVLVNGLASGSAVFLVAAGVTLIYGILHILNFAHGAFFMIGAYVSFTLLSRLDVTSFAAYLLGAVAGGLVVALLGIGVDLAVLRRLRNVDDAYSLIATFALLLVCDGLVKVVWGVDYYSVFPPTLLAGAWEFGSVLVPTFSLFLIAVGVLTFVALELGIHRSWTGRIVQAIRHDRWMTSLIGVNVEAIFTGTVAVAFLLAGVAGGLMLPNQTLSPLLGGSYLLQAFVVVIIGGLGSVRGAFLASLLLGLAEGVGTVLIANRPGLMTEIVIVLFLVWRPHGLLSGRQT